MQTRFSSFLHCPSLLGALSIAALLALPACASRPNAAPTPAPTISATPQAQAAESAEAAKLETEFADALTAPLADLNLVRKAIPPALEAARKAPYGPPSSDDCTGLRQEVEALDRALGADLDTPPSVDKPSLLERGSDLASDAVISAVRDSTTGILPFRGWLRRLTGAKAHANAVIAAVTAGAVRRAYLKGLGQAQGCPQPAAPIQILPPESEQSNSHPKQ